MHVSTSDDLYVIQVAHEVPFRLPKTCLCGDVGSGVSTSFQQRGTC